MSCEERKLVCAVADALSYPHAAAMICWDAASVIPASNSRANKQGRARRAGANAHRPEESSVIGDRLQRARLQPGNDSHCSIAPQRIARMLNLMAEEGEHLDPAFADAARRARQAIAALEVFGVVAIAALDESTATTARALADAIGMVDSKGEPLPWRDIVEQALRDPCQPPDDRAALGCALWRMDRRNEAMAVWRDAMVDGSADAVVAMLAYANDRAAPDILADAPSTASAAALATLETVRRAFGRDILPYEWCRDRPRWMTATRALRRLILEGLRDGKGVSPLLDPGNTPRWEPPLRETLPPPLLRIVTAQQLRLTRWWEASPWLDGREVMTILREQGMDDAAIAERMARVNPSQRSAEAWRRFVPCPSATQLAAVCDAVSSWSWPQRAVLLSCLPDHERDAAIAVIGERTDESQRTEWAKAAVWLWRDSRAVSLLPWNRVVALDGRVLARADTASLAAAWQCDAEWLRDDAALTAEALSDSRIQETLALCISHTGRLPQWAERALRSLPIDQRDAIVAAMIASTSLPTSWLEMVFFARRLRALGWSGDHAILAATELAADGRIPSPDIVQTMLQRANAPAPWTMRNDSVAAVSSLWESVLRITADGAWISQSWATFLTLTPPPHNARTRALEWIATQALRETPVSAHGFRMLANLASHPGWNLSDAERTRLRTAVTQTMLACPPKHYERACAIEALDALAQRYHSDIWNTALDVDLMSADAARSLARALLRRWSELPIGQRAHVARGVERVLHGEDLLALRAVARMEGMVEAS